MSEQQSETSHKKRPSGRRVGESGTKEAILDAAQDLFAKSGYDGASLRSIAAQAGVDPALIRHFFGSKQGLFAFTMTHRTEIPTRIAKELTGDPGDVGRRVTDTYLTLWEDESTRPILLGLFRSAMTTQTAVRMFADTLAARIQEEGSLPAAVTPNGFMLAATHLLGVAIARHILKLPGISDMPHNELVEMLAPEIQNDLAPEAGSRSERDLPS